MLSGVVVAADLDLKSLDDLAGRVASLSDSLAVVLIGGDGERVPFQVLTTGAARDRGLEAGTLAKALGGRLKGGGGGRPDRAQGQGADASAVEGAAAWAAEELRGALGG